MMKLALNSKIHRIIHHPHILLPRLFEMHSNSFHICGSNKIRISLQWRRPPIQPAFGGVGLGLPSTEELRGSE